MHIFLIIVAVVGIVGVGGYGAYRLGRWTLQPDIEDLTTRAEYAEQLHRRMAGELDRERLIVSRLDANRPLVTDHGTVYADVAAIVPVSPAAPDITWEFGGEEGETGRWRIPRHVLEEPPAEDTGARRVLIARDGHLQIAAGVHR